MLGPESDVSAIIDQVAAAVRKQQCILFLGAGAHAPPPQGSPFDYPEAQRPPIGDDLSRALARDCKLTSTHPDEDVANLQRVALFYEIKRSRRQLAEAVHSAVHVDKRPSPMLHALAQLDFPLVVTTNYDQHFETALQIAGKHPRPVVYSPDDNKQTTDYLDDPTPQSPVIFKIHGDIDQRDSLVVTDEDYIKFVLRMSSKEPYHPVPMTVKFWLARRTTLFVGYSLLDYNLRLLFRTLRWSIDPANMPEAYSVDFLPDPLILDVWHNQRRYVKILAEDVWSFVPQLYERLTGKGLEP